MFICFVFGFFFWCGIKCGSLGIIINGQY